MANQEKKVLVVAGIPPNKKVIKFKDDNTWYDIAEKVQKYDLEKFGIKAGATVDVTFDNNVVIFLKATSNPVSEPKKEEPKESVPVANSNIETLVIVVVAKNRKVLKFKDKEGWIKISEELQTLDYDAIGLVRGESVLASFDSKGVLISVSKVESSETEEKVGETIENNTNSYSARSTNQSIEAQVAWKGAVEVVVAMLNQDHSIDVETTLTNLTKLGISLIS